MFMVSAVVHSSISAMKTAGNFNNTLRQLRRYKWVIIFPTVATAMIYGDYSKTQRFKAEQPDMFKELNSKTSVGGDWLFKR